MFRFLSPMYKPRLLLLSSLLSEKNDKFNYYEECGRPWALKGCFEPEFLL